MPLTVQFLCWFILQSIFYVYKLAYFCYSICQHFFTVFAFFGSIYLCHYTQTFEYWG
jgi:hypothetical protein